MVHTIKHYGALVAKGFCMGAADIVPGVSGGTMAFILGIYEELVSAIAHFGTKGFWTNMKTAKWGFLLAVGSGILSAAALLARPLEHLLETSPTLVWSFFFGLVLASVIVVAKRVPAWTPRLVVALLIGVVVAYTIVGLVPVRTPEEPWFLVLSGAIAICAMILPGISGAFLLVLLGKYEFILSAVNNRDLMTIAYVGLGAVVGIIAFSQILGWLFRQYHDVTVALLTGLMIGSLRKLWPWQVGFEGETSAILLCIITGAVLVGVIEWLAHRKTS